MFKGKHIVDANYLIKRFPEINPATIYRNIQRFLNDGIIKEVNIKSDMASYELAEDDHQHFLCEGCGEIEEIKINKTWILNSLQKDHVVNDIEIVIKGKCAECI